MPDEGFVSGQSEHDDVHDQRAGENLRDRGDVDVAADLVAPTGSVHEFVERRELFVVELIGEKRRELRIL